MGAGIRGEAAESILGVRYLAEGYLGSAPSTSRSDPRQTKFCVTVKWDQFILPKLIEDIQIGKKQTVVSGVIALVRFFH